MASDNSSKRGSPRMTPKKTAVEPKAAKPNFTKRSGDTIWIATADHYNEGSNDAVASVQNELIPDQGVSENWHQRSRERRGGVITENGELLFQKCGEGIAVPAVYHHQIRKELLALAPTGKYRFNPKHGEDVDDVTSFLPSQEAWGPKREHYPPVLFQYRPPSPRDDPDYLPKEWYHNGRLVLDKHDQPVIHFRDIPDVVSSAFPAYAIEAIMRIDSRIQYPDIVARMPKILLRKSGKDGNITPNTLTLRTFRFRRQAGCLSWNKDSNGNKRLEDLLEAHLPPELKAANTTLGFRDLTKEEEAGLKGNAAAAPAAPTVTLVVSSAPAAPAVAPAIAYVPVFPPIEKDHGDVEGTVREDEDGVEADAEGESDDYDAAWNLL
ncbi:hypothetical protein MMC29_004282 [Sticta canariensis]|nr:hypothetical protein [Sticta canariensis]